MWNENRHGRLQSAGDINAKRCESNLRFDSLFHNLLWQFNNWLLWLFDTFWSENYWSGEDTLHLLKRDRNSWTEAININESQCNMVLGCMGVTCNHSHISSYKHTVSVPAQMYELVPWAHSLARACSLAHLCQWGQGGGGLGVNKMSLSLESTAKQSCGFGEGPNYGVTRVQRAALSTADRTLLMGHAGAKRTCENTRSAAH